QASGSAATLHRNSIRESKPRSRPAGGTYLYVHSAGMDDGCGLAASRPRMVDVMRGLCRSTAEHAGLFVTTESRTGGIVLPRSRSRPAGGTYFSRSTILSTS